MKQFVDLLKQQGRSFANVEIFSVTSMMGGYLLAVEYTQQNDTGYQQEAVFVVEDDHGPKEGELHIGWTHKIHEHDAPKERPMREWGPKHPEYDDTWQIGGCPSDWDGGPVQFRDGRDYPEHLKGRKFPKWLWPQSGNGSDIISYPSKSPDWVVEEANAQ